MHEEKNKITRTKAWQWKCDIVCEIKWSPIAKSRRIIFYDLTYGPYDSSYMGILALSITTLHVTNRSCYFFILTNSVFGKVQLRDPRKASFLQSSSVGWHDFGQFFFHVWCLVCPWLIVLDRCSGRSAERQRWRMEMASPPEEDFCSICHENFSIPFQANCSHWFCGKCQLFPYSVITCLLFATHLRVIFLIMQSVTNNLLLIGSHNSSDFFFSFFFVSGRHSI